MTKELLEEELTEFECRFGMPSEEYYAQYVEGEVGDWISDLDAIWGAGTYECYLAMKQRLGQRDKAKKVIKLPKFSKFCQRQNVKRKAGRSGPFHVSRITHHASRFTLCHLDFDI